MYGKIEADIEEEPIQEDVWIGPLDEQRTATDTPYIIVFCIFFVLWIGVAVYAFTVGETYEIYFVELFYRLTLVHAIKTNYIETESVGARLWVLGYLFICLVILSIFIVLFRWATRLLVWITMLLTTIGLLLIINLIGLYIYQGYISYVVILPMFLIVVVYAMIVHAFFKIGIDIVCEVIKDSFKALFFFPSTFMFIVFQFIAHLVAIGFSITVYQYLYSINSLTIDLDNDYENEEFENITSVTVDYDQNNETFVENFDSRPHHFIYLFQVINIVSCLWINSFIMGTGRMILTATFATWYHIKDTEYVPNIILPKCAVMVVRYHMGTIAFASSLFTIVPMLHIIWKCSRDKLRELCKQPSSILSWLTIMINFTFDALAMCAIHGNAFYESAKDSYILMMKHPMSFLVINTVSECVIFFGSLLVTLMPILIALISSLIIEGMTWTRAEMTGIVVATIIAPIITLIFFMLFRAASNTIRFCYFEDSKLNQELEIKLYEIHQPED